MVVPVKETGLSLSSSHGDFADMYVRFLKTASNAIRSAANLLYYVYDDYGETLVLRAHHAVSPGGAKPHRTAFPGQGPLGIAAREKGPINLGEFRHDHPAKLIYDDGTGWISVRSVIACPVVHPVTLAPIGVIAADSPQNSAFGKHDELAIADIARSVADIASLERSAASADLTVTGLTRVEAAVAEIHRATRFGDFLRLWESNVLELADADKVQLALKYNPNSDDAPKGELKPGSKHDVYLVEAVASPDGTHLKVKFSHTPLTGSLLFIGMTLKSAEPVSLSDLDAKSDMIEHDDRSRFHDHLKYKSFLGIPVMLHNELIGAVGFWRRENARFSPHERRLASILTSAAAPQLAVMYREGKKRSAPVPDHITGTMTYRQLLNRVNNRLHQARDEKAAMVMIDIRDFRGINTRHGMTAADEVLRQIADFLENSFVQRGIVGRYYADRFVLYLPGMSEFGAVPEVQRLLSLLKAKTFHINGREMDIRLNFGICSLKPGDTSAEELFIRSAHALDWAKSTRQNNIGIYSDIAEAGASGFNTEERPVSAGREDATLPEQEPTEDLPLSR